MKTILLLLLFCSTKVFASATDGFNIIFSDTLTNVTKQVNNTFANTTITLRCPSNVIITGKYDASLTQSVTWIKTSQATIIPSSAIVKLDADAVNGFITLNPGFSTQAGATFTAQVRYRCTDSIAVENLPSLNKSDIKSTEKSKTIPDIIAGNIKVYPNPTSNNISVQHTLEVKNIQLFNTQGNLMVSINTKNKTLTVVDLSAYPSGIYTLFVNGKLANKIIKQ